MAVAVPVWVASLKSPYTVAVAPGWTSPSVAQTPFTNTSALEASNTIVLTVTVESVTSVTTPRRPVPSIPWECAECARHSATGEVTCRNDGSGPWDDEEPSPPPQALTNRHATNRNRQ